MNKRKKTFSYEIIWCYKRDRIHNEQRIALRRVGEIRSFLKTLKIDEKSKKKKK